MQPTADRSPAPQSTGEIEFMFDIARSIPYFSQMTATEQDDLVRKLLAYECYGQALSLLRWRIENSTRGEIQKLDDYTTMLGIWHHGCEDSAKFVETLKECVQKVRPSFSTIRVRLVENIVGADEWTEQERIYKTIAPAIEDVSQRVLLLERLAFLYEKKLTLNSEVETTYNEILALDPNNVRALRYFKVVQVQNGMWKDAARTLEKLVAAHPISFEKQRAAFELSQVFLYQLNQPEKARDTIVKYCADSKIDSSQTYAEALERMGAHSELLSYLGTRESKVGDSAERSRIKHKMGLICLKTGNSKEAMSHFQDSVYLSPQNLLAHESLISLLADSKLNNELVLELKSLANSVQSDSSKQVIQSLLQRANQLGIQSKA